MRLIDADALEALYEEGTDPDDCYADMAYIRAEHIFDAPTIEAEPVRHGRWLNRKRNGYAVLVCSECEREKEGYTRTAYCPHCGMKMNGGAENG